MDYNAIMLVFRRLAIEAGEKILEIYHSDNMGITVKSDDSPVTLADQAADALISRGLQAAFPEIPLITEEQAETHNNTSNTFIIVDPLDGTKEFIQHRGDFTVNIALVEAGIPTRGVVYAPAKGRLFYTDANGRTIEEAGPFDEAQVGVHGPINVRQPDNNALKIVASKSHRDPATDNYISQYNSVDTASAGSSLKFCLVASGEADLYPRMGRTMEWDTAAGHAILTGAGGKVVRFDDHTPLIYGKPGFENPFFIAYAPGITLQLPALGT